MYATRVSGLYENVVSLMNRFNPLNYSASSYAIFRTAEQPMITSCTNMLRTATILSRFIQYLRHVISRKFESVRGGSNARGSLLHADGQNLNSRPVMIEIGQI